MIDFRDGKGFVIVGATTGQVIASQVGGIGVVGGFGSVEVNLFLFEFYPTIIHYKPTATE